MNALLLTIDLDPGAIAFAGLFKSHSNTSDSVDPDASKLAWNLLKSRARTAPKSEYVTAVLEEGEEREAL